MDVNEEFTAQDAAEEFAKLNEAEASPEAPADNTPAEPVKDDIPTVDDSQEVVPQAASPAAPEVDPQAERLAEQQKYLQTIARLQDELRQRGAPPKPVEPSNELTLEQLNELWLKNPIEAMRRAAATDPETLALKAQLKKFEQVEQGRAEQAFADRINFQQKQVEQKYPDFKQGSVAYNAAFNYLLQNRHWLQDVARKDSDFNLVEHCYRQVAFDLLQQKAKAQEQKLVDKRRQSATVKPGGTAAVTHSGDNVARAAAADLAQKGEAIPDDWVRAAEKAEARWK